jgi:hypothetical protein
LINFSKCPIDDPLGVLAEKIFGARVVAERNTAMRRLATYAAQNGAEDFARPVKPGMRAPAGMAKVAGGLVYSHPLNVVKSGQFLRETARRLKVD